MSGYPPGPGQPYYAGQPYPYGAPQPYPVPPPRRSGGRVALIILGAVLAVCCLGGVAVGGYLYVNRSDGGSGTGADSPRAAVTAFLEDYRSGNYAAAYAKVCPDFRKKGSLDDFTRQAKERPLASYEVGPQSINARPGRSTAEVKVVLTFTDGERTGATIEALETGDGWQVCGGMT